MLATEELLLLLPMLTIMHTGIKIALASTTAYIELFGPLFPTDPAGHVGRAAAVVLVLLAVTVTDPIIDMLWLPPVMKIVLLLLLDTVLLVLRTTQNGTRSPLPS